MVHAGGSSKFKVRAARILSLEGSVARSFTSFRTAPGILNLERKLVPRRLHGNF